MLHEHICVICGGTFYSDRHTAFTCSEQCRRERQIVTNAIKREEKKNSRKTKEKDSLSVANEKAREQGISYGRYKALEYMKNNRI